jgi:hypothetical protein
VCLGGKAQPSPSLIRSNHCVTSASMATFGPIACAAPRLRDSWTHTREGGQEKSGSLRDTGDADETAFRISEVADHESIR